MPVGEAYSDTDAKPTGRPQGLHTIVWASVSAICKAQVEMQPITLARAGQAAAASAPQRATSTGADEEPRKDLPTTLLHILNPGFFALSTVLSARGFGALKVVPKKRRAGAVAMTMKGKANWRDAIFGEARDLLVKSALCISLQTSLFHPPIPHT